MLLLTFIALATATVGAPPAPASGTKGGAVGTILFYNATQGPVRYRTWLTSAPGSTLVHELRPGEAHLFRLGTPMSCAFGTSGPVEVRSGALYEFRGGSKALTLKEVTASMPTASEPGATGLAAGRGAVVVTPAEVRPNDEADRQEIARLKAETARLVDEVKGLRRALDEARGRSGRDAAGASEGIGLRGPSGVAHPASVESDGGPVRIPLALELTREDGLAPSAVRLAARFRPARGAVRVEPEIASIPASGALNAVLVFSEVTAGGIARGEVVVTDAAGVRPGELTIPVEVTHRVVVSSPGADPGALDVLTWPAGAGVYLATLSGEQPWARSYLGTTPVRCRLAPGRYKVLLTPPGPGDGRWLGPAARAEMLDGGTGNPRDGDGAEGLTVAIEKAGSAPALVRSLWVTGAGPPTGLLVSAVKGEPDRFDAGTFETFLVAAARFFGRGGVPLTDDDARALHSVLRKTGWLRYQVPGVAATVDIEVTPGADPPFRFTPRRADR
jgi:hypothetical protein